MNNIIAVEGLIGAGKTTFLKNHAQKIIPNTNTIFEPINQWTNTNYIYDNTPNDDMNILLKLYKNPSRYSYSFQNWVLFTRAQQIETYLNTKPKKNEYILMERSFASANIFAQVLHEQKLLTNMEMNMFKQIHQTYSQKYNNTKYIYLQCKPNICMERIQKRNRKEEQFINLEYLHKLQTKHENWFTYLKKQKIPCLIINNENELTTNQIQTIKTWIQQQNI